MPNLSAHLFDNVLKFLAKQKTKVHHRYVVNSVKAENDFQARLVVDRLKHEGLIFKDLKDYYTITLTGRDVVDDAGGYRNFSDASKAHGSPIHGIFTEMENGGKTLQKLKQDFQRIGDYQKNNLLEDELSNFHAQDTTGQMELPWSALTETSPTKKQKGKIRSSISKFLQHWFVEKYLKPILYFIIAAFITLYVRYLIKKYYPFILD